MLLGSWQIYRLDWKNTLITEFNNQFNSQILKINDLKNINNYESKLKYRRIEIIGEFNYFKEIVILGKTYEGNAGFHIITPFKTDSGEIFLVNRGWAPKKYVEAKYTIDNN